MTDTHWPHKAWRLAIVAIVGCGVGYLAGTTSSTVAAVPQMPGSADDLSEVSQQLRRVNGRLEQLESLLATRDSVTSSRRLAPEPRSHALGEQLASSELKSAVDLLLKRASELSHRATIVDPESLRIARLQNPQPKLAAAEVLSRALQQALSKAERRSVARKLWMMAIDAVIAELGLPTNIIPDQRVPGRQLWEYIRPDGETILILTFQDGLVVAVDD
jgi:hypothetical protein